MKRVLIITYYWPPSGGSGVQRWLKMSKYLPENGWLPVIYTPENPESPIDDPTLNADVCPEAEVIKRPIFEPYSFYKKFVGVKKDQKVKVGFIDEGEHKKSWKENLTLWIRGNLFIPDARRWWVKPSVRFLKKYLKEHPVDAIITTGPPHSMHLIGMKLHEKLHIPWIADFRDPWTEIDYYNELHLTRCSDRKHHRLENQVLTKADAVVTVAPDGARRLENLGAKNVRTIYNGFDSSDSVKEVIPSNDVFTLTYLGVLSKIQNPDSLWEALSEIVAENEQFKASLKINMIGQIDHSAVVSIQNHGLSDLTEFTPYIPHSQVSEAQRSSSALLLLLMPSSVERSKGLLTGKLFEYLASGRPILCIGPEDGDAAKIISEANAGITVDFEDKEKMKEVITNLFQAFQKSELNNNSSSSVKRYSRQILTKEYVEIINQVTR